MPLTPTLPLQLCQVLEEEVRYLHGPTDEPPPTWDFRPEHFLQPEALATQIAAMDAPLAEFLRTALAPLAHDAKGLSEQFNDLLAQTKLYQLSHLPFESLSAELQEMVKLTESLGAELQGEDLRLFNRLLLEQAFPGFITEIRDARLAHVYRRLHALHREQPTAVLCLSGGGIRSATFSLGVLQGLARHDLLKQFHYLSTVSGGGYIGSWLSSWIQRHPQQLAGVTEELGKEPDTRLEPDPAPVRYLREYSNFLTPHFSFQSADVWSFIAIYIRNLIINWLVLIPLLMAGLGIPYIGAEAVKLEGVPSWGRWLFLTLSLLLIAISVAYSSGNRPSLNLKPKTEMVFLRRISKQDRFLWFCLLPLIVAGMLLGAYWAWWQKLNAPTLLGVSITGDWSWIPFVGFGLASYFLGWVFYRLKWRRFQLWELAIVFFTGPVGGWLLWLLAEKLLPDPRQVDAFEWQQKLYTSFVVPGFLLVFFLSVTLFVGLGSRAQREQTSWKLMLSEDDLEWFARFCGWLLIVIVAWSLFTPVVLLGPPTLAWLYEYHLHQWFASLGGLSGIASAVLGHSSATPANQEQAARAGWKAILLGNALAIASFLFLLFLALELSLCFAWLIEWAQTLQFVPTALLKYERVIIVFLLILGFTAAGIVMSKLINLNMFSLHAGYRNRLVRAYLGASRRKREPNPFTGFDRRDNIRVKELQTKRLFHVVNTALNLVKGQKLAWQQRKAESFIFTPLHSGSLFVGYRPTAQYGGAEGVSLGTVATISGAAANSNMGYHSTSALATFVLTLFNVRLGWWLGNPGVAGSFPARLRLSNESYSQLGYPNSAIYPIFAEAFGLTDDRNSYVMLSDGGHFENLALYEMVLRRCHTIVLVDAGQDGECKFEDLGNAMRKIRIDLGVPITFKKGLEIYSRIAQKPGQYCAIAEIEYSCVDGADAVNGQLLYFKPSFYGHEPTDIYNYAQSNPAFPHEPTLDQFFDEAQFESYRMLGSYIVNTVAGDNRDSLTLPQLFEQARLQLEPAMTE